MKHMKTSRKSSSVLICKHCKGELRYCGSGDMKDANNYYLVESIKGYAYRCPSFAPTAHAHELITKEEIIAKILSQIPL